MSGFSDVTLKFLAGVLMVAIIAVIVSKNSKAAQVIQAISAAFTNILGTVVAPISTPSTSGNGVTTANPASGTGATTATTPNNNSATTGQGTAVNH